MAKGQQLTELEGAVLGIIWSRGPITAYGVRQRFMRSTTRGWSASTGAIYPAIERLAEYGFISRTPQAGDGRASRKLQATKSGAEALRSWIVEIQDWMGGAMVDPIRTRVIYLGVLPAKDRASFLQAATRNAEAALIEARQPPLDPQTRDPKSLSAAMLGAQMDIEARIRWLAKVREMLDLPE